jgi:hypothetical protein
MVRFLASGRGKPGSGMGPPTVPHDMDVSGYRAWMAGAAAVGTLLAWAAPARAAGAPQITGGRSAAGTPQVGERLESTATWTAAAPARTSYTWLRCTGMAPESCRAIAGARDRGYVVRAADRGAHLRVSLRVTNRRGWAWVTSAPTDEVAARTAPVAPEPDATGGVLGRSDAQAALLDPFPVVRIRGFLTPAGARVQSLTVRAPARARVAVSCSGRGCPTGAWSHAASLVHLTPFEVRLRAGVRLTIAVTRPGWIGKHTVITLRNGRPPTRRDRCLYPGASHPRACPAA